MHDDGSLLAALINCASLCLLDASIPLRGILASMSCCLCSNDNGTDDILLVDPTRSEEQTWLTCCTVAVLSSDPKKADLMRASGGDPMYFDKVPLLQIVGTADIKKISALRDRSVAACDIVQHSFAASLNAKLSKCHIFCQ